MGSRGREGGPPRAGRGRVPARVLVDHRNPAPACPAQRRAVLGGPAGPPGDPTVAHGGLGLPVIPRRRGAARLPVRMLVPERPLRGRPEELDPPATPGPHPASTAQPQVHCSITLQRSGQCSHAPDVVSPAGCGSQGWTKNGNEPAIEEIPAAGLSTAWIFYPLRTSHADAKALVMRPPAAGAGV